jgi:membrane protease YdiL (CAAX protease family)
MILLEIILVLLGIYLAIGGLFALYFVVFQIAEFDESATETSVFFRIIIFFGAMVFWVFLFKQILQAKEKIEVTAHRL